MATTHEIKNRIKGVQDTQKITNAMYLISSTKMRKAKLELDQTRPYFNELKSEIKRIFRTVEDVESRYFFHGEDDSSTEGTRAMLVITADKGLAGAYNMNVIKEAMSLYKARKGTKLFVVGEYGRQYFSAHHIPIEKSFLYTAQHPTLARAREISNLLLDLYLKKEIGKIFLVYTDLVNGMTAEVRSTRLLPFHRTYFNSTKEEKAIKTPFEFMPSPEKVLDSIIPSYITGFIYSALIDSFCSEQNARLTAMDSANQNAQALIADLSLQYNHIRQGAITQEITEVSSGARGMKKKKAQNTF